MDKERDCVRADGRGRRDSGNEESGNPQIESMQGVHWGSRSGAMNRAGAARPLQSAEETDLEKRLSQSVALEPILDDIQFDIDLTTPALFPLKAAPPLEQSPVPGT